MLSSATMQTIEVPRPSPLQLLTDGGGSSSDLQCRSWNQLFQFSAALPAKKTARGKEAYCSSS